MKVSVAKGVLACLLLCVPGAAFAHGGGGGGAGGHAAGGHGGHTTRYYYYYPYYNYDGTPLAPAGAPAELPLELTDAPLQAVEGDLTPGAVIAQHTLRAREARVLLEPAVVNQDRQIAAGTVLAKMSTPVKGLSLWCDIHLRPGLFHPMEHDCLSARDGKFVQLWIGVSPSYFLGIEKGVVRADAMLTAPAAFREARADERPTGLLGYKSCGEDALASPPRFALAVTDRASDKWFSGGKAACRFGFWPDDRDRTQVDVDGLAVKMTSGSASTTVHYVVSGRIPPIAELAELTPTDSVHAAGAGAASPTGKGAEASKGSAGPPPVRVAAPAWALVPAGAPALVASGELKPGQTFLTMPVRHGLTAVLRSEVKVYRFAEQDVLTVDQPLFGLPPSKAGGSVVWCAPRRTDDPSAPRWSSICLAEQNGGYYAMEIPIAMMATSLPWRSARPIAPPTIEPGPASLPSMTVSYVFLGFTDPTLPTRFARVEIRLDWGEGPKAIGSLSAAVGADGLARFTLLDGQFTLKPLPAPAKRNGVEASPPAELGVLAAAKPVSPL